MSEPASDPEQTSDQTIAEAKPDPEDTATIRASQFPTISVDASVSTARPKRDPEESDGVPQIGRAALNSLVPPKPDEEETFVKKRYERLELLGVGGEGRVYAALDRNFRREVAIKVMRTGTADDVKRRETFIKEARVTATLEHPNILPVYDIDSTDDGRTYFTMRKAQGRTLSALVKRAVANPEHPPDEISTWDKAVRIIDKVCDAVAYAHSVGYVHQDIKPGNIILGGFGNVLLVDWGTAVTRAERATPTLKVVGTPTYMSPEQARADPIDERTDVYCLGATLFRLVTLKPPITEPDPIALWEKKCAGHIDSVPCPPGVPQELLDIALKAMAASASDRYQSVTELQQALRDVQRHDQSLALCTSVASRLAAPEPVADYDEATALLARVQSALELWPENERAEQLVPEVRARHVELALQTGDLALAERLLASPVADREGLEKRVAAARVTRHQQRLRARWMAAAVVAAIGLLASLAVFVIRDHYLQQSSWRDVASYDLARPGDGVHVGRSRERLDEADPVPSEQLTSEGLLLRIQETYWLTDAQSRGDFRFELRVKWLKHVDGLEVMADAQRAQPQMFWYVPSSLTCQFGGWQGTTTYLAVQEKAGMPDSTRAVQHDFSAGRWYDLVFERREGRVRLYVDGSVVLEDFVFVPFEGKDNRWFGIRAWNQPVVISKVHLQRLSIPEKASPVVAGDSVFRLGMYADAVDQYEMVADDHPDTSVEEVALAKAYLAAQRQGNRERRHDLLARLERKYPRSDYLGRCIEEEAVESWREGRYDDALVRISQSFARKPDSRVAAQILSMHARARWPQTAVNSLMTWVGRTTNVHRLDLSNLGLRTVAFLKQDRIDELALNNNHIEDISPLQHVAIQRLHLSNNPISDLGALRGKALQVLNLTDTRVSDLSPLRGTGLTSMDVSRTPVRDLSVLKSLPLQNFTATELGLGDLEVLRGLKLHTLVVDYNEVESLEPLRGMPLESFHAVHNRIQTLDPVKAAAITDLAVGHNPLGDIDALASMKALVNVDLTDCGIRDPKPLAGRRFDGLHLAFNAISDVSALATVQTPTLDLSHNQITDASPLAAVRFESLDLWQNPLEKLGDIADAPPKLFWFSAERFAGSLADRLSTRWKASPSTADFAYVVDVQRAWASRDRSRLMALRRRVDGRFYLALYVEQSLEEARATAASLGAHLFWLRTPQLSDHLHAAMPLYWPGYWQDCRIGDHEIIAPDGSRFDGVDVYIETFAWDFQGTTGIAYSYAPGFGAVITHWRRGTPPERQVYMPLLEWNDAAPAATP